MSTAKRLILLLNKPVEYKLPHVVRIVAPTPEIDALLKKQSEDVPYLSKNEVSRHFCVLPMTGPRYHMLELNIPTDLLK